MGADSSASPAKDNVFPSDRSNTPLLPRPAGVHDIVSNSTLVATVQPPLPVVLVQRDNDSDFDKNGMGRATKEGYQTGICDCCTQPGGGQLCKQLCNPDFSDTHLHQVSQRNKDFLLCTQAAMVAGAYPACLVKMLRTWGLLDGLGNRQAKIMTSHCVGC